MSYLDPASMTESMIAFFHEPEENRHRVRLPWFKMKDIFEFRLGEVSLIAGINGHGKSMLWGQVVLSLLAQGEKVLIVSLEMQPVYTMARMIRQSTATGVPPRPMIERLTSWSSGKLWIYDRLGKCDPQRLVALIRYAKDKLGITHVVVDNMTKVIDGEKDIDAQKNFADLIGRVAHDLHLHVHLVMHIRKLEDESKVPSKMDIKGGGAVMDMADNIFIVWRNKAKEQGMRDGEKVKAPEPDCLLVLDKQRNAAGEDNEGRFGLWFDRASNQYVEKRGSQPVPIPLKLYEGLYETTQNEVIEKGDGNAR